ncbi:hypothetical protein [Sphaerisporangium sp. NPDC051011]|uniref:hypothetical protein n=1 Tax=Sphaerisporangium sp. NPDC051011 TaxID=3155792 RepID=UPI0033E6FE28
MAGATWQCAACDTYNDAQRASCMVCDERRAPETPITLIRPPARPTGPAPPRVFPQPPPGLTRPARAPARDTPPPTPRNSGPVMGPVPPASPAPERRWGPPDPGSVGMGYPPSATWPSYLTPDGMPPHAGPAHGTVAPMPGPYGPASGLGAPYHPPGLPAHPPRPYGGTAPGTRSNFAGCLIAILICTAGGIVLMYVIFAMAALS